MIKHNQTLIKYSLLCFITLFTISCASSTSSLSRVRALEQRLDKLELVEDSSKEFKKISARVNRSLDFLEQRLDSISENQSSNVSELEIIKRDLNKLNQVVKQLEINLKKSFK